MGNRPMQWTGLGTREGQSAFRTLKLFLGNILEDVLEGKQALPP